MLISDTKNMPILNTNVTFKYECCLFLKQTARHKVQDYKYGDNRSLDQT